MVAVIAIGLEESFSPQKDKVIIFMIYIGNYSIMGKNSVLTVCIVCISLLLPTKGYCVQEDSLEISYPAMQDILYAYIRHYINGPKNLSELKAFAHDYQQALPGIIFYNDILNTVTFPKLEKDECLEFVSDSCSFALKGRDFIYEQQLLCCFNKKEIYPEEKNAVLLERIRSQWYGFECNGKSIFLRKNLPNSLLNDFWKSMKKLYRKHEVTWWPDVGDVVLIEWKTGKGLCYYCNNEKIESSPYFADMERTIRTFCKKYKISRLVFHTLQK